MNQDRTQNVIPVYLNVHELFELASALRIRCMSPKNIIDIDSAHSALTKVDESIRSWSSSIEGIQNNIHETITVEYAESLLGCPLHPYAASFVHHMSVRGLTIFELEQNEDLLQRFSEFLDHMNTEGGEKFGSLFEPTHGTSV